MVRFFPGSVPCECQGCVAEAGSRKEAGWEVRFFLSSCFLSFTFFLLSLVGLEDCSVLSDLPMICEQERRFSQLAISEMEQQEVEDVRRRRRRQAGRGRGRGRGRGSRGDGDREGAVVLTSGEMRASIHKSVWSRDTLLSDDGSYSLFFLRPTKCVLIMRTRFGEPKLCLTCTGPLHDYAHSLQLHVGSALVCEK